MKRVEKYSEQILNHPFAKELLDDITPAVHRLSLLKKHKRTRKFQKIEQYFHPTRLSEPEQYFHSALYYVLRLHDSFERLEYIRTFLTHFRIPKQYKEMGIERSDYIKYHYSNHAVNLVGIFDIALILANNVFRLGLPEKQCRSELIIQNSWVRSRGIDKILKNLDSKVLPLREPRNLFIHRGWARDDKFIPFLEMLELLKRKSAIPETILSSRSDAIIARISKLETLKILDELNEQEEPVFNISIELLSRLHPIYKFWKDILLTKRDKKSD